MTAKIISLAEAKADRARRQPDPFALWAQAWAELFFVFWRI
jgi:hypothetical protein